MGSLDPSGWHNIVGFRILDLGLCRTDKVIPHFVKYLGYYDLHGNPHPSPASTQYAWSHLHIFITTIYRSETDRQNGIASVLIMCSTHTAWMRAKEVLLK